MKFGGSSVKSEERIKAAAEIILSQEDKKILVFSALGDTTDNLIEAGQKALGGKVVFKEIKDFHYDVAARLDVNTDIIDELLNNLERLLSGISMLGELSEKTKDLLVSFGERLSVRIIAQYLTNNFFKAKAIDAFDLGLRTDSDFGDAKVLDGSLSEVKKNLEVLIKDGITPVVTGYIAKDEFGNITTLGRGGTDLTASLLASAVGAKEVQVWKDVDGIMTTDPRIVSSAISLDELAFEEASEMAYFGAKVLHPLSIQPAMKADIPVRVLNSYNPKHTGTTILRKTTPPKNAVRAISCKSDVILVDIVSTRMLHAHGFMAKVFNIFRDASLPVDMLATSEISISLTLNCDKDLDKVVAELEKFSKVSVQREKAIISLIGDISRSSKILKEAFTVLDANNRDVQMISKGASKVNIGFVVENSDSKDILTELHNQFFPVSGMAA
ncbi:UNVERIFIED_CONTAM: hypothetical protein GTU68_065533 [Idotea baltica]|nr:hypothetical protein [Idotea baltica]